MTISVAGGRGGNGCMSFRREKYLPNGGPDGGNGGKGGSVFIVASLGMQTLSDFEHKRSFSAGNGEHGSGGQKNGRSGDDITLTVPCGTIITDAETGEGLADLVEPGDMFLAAIGGRGGRGNRVFASSRRRAPRFSEKGEIGESARLHLDLKMIADIGLVGLPNAGKSSILAALSNASPKIAPYPFTTLSPNLGVMRDDIQSTVIADIPGLIEGAGDDKGLGLRFLRHIERTRLILHIVDISSSDIDSIRSDIATIQHEMSRFDADLPHRRCAVVGNKIDLIDQEIRDGLIAELKGAFAAEGTDFLAVSAMTGEHIDELAGMISKFSSEHPRPSGGTRLYATARTAEDDASPAPRPHKQQIQIVKLPDGSFRVLNLQLERAAERYDLSQEENTARFTKLLRKYRVEELLEAYGAAPGSSVAIGRVEFDFYPDEY